MAGLNPGYLRRRSGSLSQQRGWDVTDVTKQLTYGQAAGSTGAAFADYDWDGFVDLMAHVTSSSISPSPAVRRRRDCRFRVSPCSVVLGV